MDESEFNLPAALYSKTWCGFDFDDTLHEFRKASSQASLGVFKAISDQYGANLEELSAKYQIIMGQWTTHAFTDGRTSTEYRRERFTRLLQAHGIDGSESADHLLEIYRTSLQSGLTQKAARALQLLQTLQRMGKNVTVATEGPAEAQEWTVRELGSWPYIDVLVTSNEIGISKVDGLFGVV